MKNRHKEIERSVLQVLNRIAEKEFKTTKKARIKYCNNKWCLEMETKKGNINYHIKTKTGKIIPVCKSVNFCPDACYHYFDYKPEIKGVKE